MNDNHLLRRSELGLEAVRGMGAIVETLTILPLVDRLLGDTETLGQHGSGFVTDRNLGTHGWGGAGILVQSNLHYALPVDCIDCTSSRNTSRAKNSGKRFLSMQSSGMRQLLGLLFDCGGDASLSEKPSRHRPEIEPQPKAAP